VALINRSLSNGVFGFTENPASWITESHDELFSKESTSEKTKHQAIGATKTDCDMLSILKTRLQRFLGGTS
jgi:hypothetical protein